MAFDSCRKLHQPGEQVPTTGIYRVLHQAHRKAHDVMLRKLDTFPPCQHCKAEVRFELVHSVEEAPP